MRPPVLIAVLIILAGLVGAMVRPHGSGILLSGDLAKDVQTAMLQMQPRLQIATDRAAARVEVILVTDWEKLAFVPGAVDECGDACRAERGNEVVQIIRPTLGGMRKIVFVNIASFLDSTDTARFSLTSEGRRCLATGLIAESTSWPGADWPPDCVDDSVVVSRLRPGVS